MFLVGCALASSWFLIMVFGANARTVNVGIGFTAAVGLLAYGVDRALLSTCKSHSPDGALDEAVIRRGVWLLAVVLGVAIAVFIAQIGLGIFRSVR